MTLYVFSKFTGGWHVTALGGTVNEIAKGIATEHKARQLAIDRAKEDRPSYVLRISETGDAERVATFPAEA